MSVTIYHNPRCSKSRQALAILEDKGVQLDVIEYLKTPLSAADIKGLATLLAIENSPRAMMRVKEDDYKNNNLAEANDAALFKAMAEYPKLIERPIIVHGSKAIIARPPEKALDII
tara:strand:+ start:54515 stop:54862 length:348 start_codon:yes stop_codon:yes gene_type:complete